MLVYVCDSYCVLMMLYTQVLVDLLSLTSTDIQDQAFKSQTLTKKKKNDFQTLCIILKLKTSTDQ